MHNDQVAAQDAGAKAQKAEAKVQKAEAKAQKAEAEVRAKVQKTMLISLELQGQTITVFTLVTSVFLPLSFICSVSPPLRTSLLQGSKQWLYLTQRSL